MSLLAKRVLALAVIAAFQAFLIWAVFLDSSREKRSIEKAAFCVLQLPAGGESVSATFTTSHPIEYFQVWARPGKDHGRFSLAVHGSKGLVSSMNGDATRFGFGHDIPPGTYTATLSQEPGGQGVWISIADKVPARVTGWQILSRFFLGMVVVSGVWAWAARRSKSPRQRVVSLYVFQILLLSVLAMFLYLLFHEGGHALAQMFFGGFDYSKSDFWGIHGNPHSSGNSGVQLKAWQYAFISGAGPILPTLIGWGLFLVWITGPGRRLRNAGPVVRLYFTAIVFMAVFPFIAVAGTLLGLVSDGDMNGFFSNVPGPLWLVETILWGVFLVNVLVLWRIVPELVRAWKAILQGMKNPPAGAREPEEVQRGG